MDLGRKWLVNFNAEKIHLVFSFDLSNNTDTIDVKMNGSVLEGKSSFNILGLTFSSKLDWDSYIISIAKTLQENWSFDSFSEVSFSLDCSVSL